MSNTKILAFAGSARRESINDRLLTTACRLASDAGAAVSHIQLRDYALPIFDEDVESAGFPDNAAELKKIFKDHDALLIACPEYNSSITPLLKNVIDWVSRPTGDQTPLEAFAGKTACLISGSPGQLGGLRGLRHVREILSNIGVMVVPDQFALPSAFNAFSEDGQISDEKMAQRLSSCVLNFLKTAQRQSG